VYQPQEAGFFSGAKSIHSVPTSAGEGVKSSLMGVLEKPRFISFVQFIQNWEDDKGSTHQDFDPRRHTMLQVFQKFGLQESTIDFIGHAVALHNNDDYLTWPCGITITKCKLYLTSLMQYGGSPFIYPIYGLGGLPEGFSRLAAINRGTYMLNKPVDELMYNEEGKVMGVRSGEEIARAPLVICDPSYAEEARTRPTGQIIRAICILGAPIPNTRTSDHKPANSVQIILPQKQLQRKNDIYIMMVSWAHCIAAKDKYVAIVSTVVETSDPEAEIEPAMALLGPVYERFVSVTETRAPVDDGVETQVFVTASYDACSHFEDASDEVLKMWKTITGTDLDLTITPEDEDDQ